MASTAPASPDPIAAPAGTVLHVTTVPQSLRFLAGQAGHVRRAGFAVHAVSSPGPEMATFAAEEGATVHPVPMTRRMTPLADLRALAGVLAVVRRVRPDIVHGHTPKGGLLAMLAGWLAGTPVRIYHLRGLPLLTARGVRRLVLRATETLSCRLAHQVIAVSGSMRDAAIAEGLCPPGKLAVLAGGSGNGVDAAGRFAPRPPDVRRAVRAQHGIPAGATVIGFVGRLVREKGVAELAQAWRTLSARHPALHLLVVGPPEDEDPLPAGVLQALRADWRVHLAGLDYDTPRLYAAMDVVALPTWREGFPNVPLEAAAMALPVVATDVPGCTDAVVHGETGLLVPPRDPPALAAALERYLADPALRAAHGAEGRRRVLAAFRREVIWAALVDRYRALVVAARVARVEAACASRT